MIVIIPAIDYEKHNTEVNTLWSDYSTGKNKRVPMSLACNPRMILLDPSLNDEKYTFEQYFADPEIMAKVQLKFIEYRDTALLYDHIMGAEYIQYGLYPDFQNVFEPNWLGCPIHYHEHNDPGTSPILNDDNKYDYLSTALEPMSGISGKAMQYYEHFLEMKKSGYTYKGKPIEFVYGAGGGSDGPFTNACSLRGATNFCLDLYLDTEYALALMNFITENSIKRIKAFRKATGQPEKLSSMYLADDSIALLSTDDYVRFVLPFHKKLCDELSTGESPNMIHLCGDATRHFATISRELNVKSFDTGFPVKHGELLRELGPDIQLYGGVHVDILLNGTAEQVEAETKRILEDVKPHSRKFIIKEANNLSPRTPPKNIAAMYEAVKKYGVFTQ